MGLFSHRQLRRALRVARLPSRALKSTLLFVVVVGAFVFAATFNRDPDLSYVKVAFLSGNEYGNYFAIVKSAAEQARRQHGRIENLSSAGSIENIERLAAARKSCDVQFALVQEGIPWPQSHPFQLIGRLPVSESFVILGRDADRIKSVADLRGKRIGIGPAKSGTEYVARQLMGHLDGLDVTVSTQPLQQQLAMLERGELDLGAMVIDPDAQRMVDAVRQRKLQIVDLASADALAHRLRSARAGTIKAGYYDPIGMLPPTDKRVIEIDTLIIGNGCAHESATQGLITALTRVFPDFVRVNREQPNLTGLEYASAARSYFDAQGPDPVGQYVPWVIDIMPTARWLQLIFAFSVLFGAQALWHRFRLWRLDARRVSIEEEVARLFGSGTTLADIAQMRPAPEHRAPEARARLDTVLHELTLLARRCRWQSVSILVPMGQEMNYRYQEGLVADLLQALRQFRARLDH